MRMYDIGGESAEQCLNRVRGAVDHAAGIILRCKPGDFVKKGAPAAELFAESPERCRAAAQRFQGAVCVGPEPPQKRPLIRARVTKDGIERF